jgi:hypothetical protein
LDVASIFLYFLFKYLFSFHFLCIFFPLRVGDVTIGVGILMSLPQLLELMGASSPTAGSGGPGGRVCETLSAF